MVVSLTSTSKFNSSLTAQRRANFDGTYDTDTNLMLLPKIMQPTHVKWERIPTPSEHYAQQEASRNTQNDSILTNVDPANNHASTDILPANPTTKTTIFSPVNPVISRNYLITDTTFISPAENNLGIPGPDGDMTDLGPNGLSSIPQAVINELPDDCRAAFEAQLMREREWKVMWGSEMSDGMRGKFRIGYDRFPV